jgi:hypothetical protein
MERLEDRTLPAAPVAVVAGDFTNNGAADLVVADGPTGRIAIQLGHGDGTFEAPVTVTVVSSPASVIAADLNGDGRLDLAVAAADGIVVLLGNGNGSFRRLPTVASPTGRPEAIGAGDFNHDHHLDLAAVNSTDDVWVFLGRGDGTFLAADRIPLAAGVLAMAITSGDFEGHGGLDLAVAETGRNAVAVLHGNGDGSFRALGEYLVQKAPLSLVAGDFTGDGRDDLAVANRDGDGGATNPGSVSILLANPDGSFRSGSSFGIGAGPVVIALGHFNGNNHNALDLAVADGNDSDAWVLLGNGNGTFGTPHSESNLGNAGSLAVADFDGNGSSDLAVGNGDDGGVTIELSTPQPGGDPPYYFLPPGPTASVWPTPFLADVNGDGTPDSIIVNRAGQILVRLARRGQPGVFTAPFVLNPNRPALAVTPYRAGNRTLLAAADESGHTISLYALDGKPLAQTTLHLTAPRPLPIRLVAGHLASGQPNFDDLAVLDASPGSTPRVYVFVSDGNGGFVDEDTTRQEDLDGSGPSGLALADINGVNDIIVSDAASDDVSVLSNNGDGFLSKMQFPTGKTPVGIVAGPFTGHGTTDLVTADEDSRTLSLLRGLGDGTFLDPVSLSLPFRPTAIAPGRFTTDPSPDLAVLDGDRGLVHVFLNDSTGHFREVMGRAPLLAGNAPTSLSVSDVNGDGFADLQVGNQLGDVLTFLGNGDGTFRPYLRADQSVALAVAGPRQFILSDHAQDRLAVQNGLGNPSHVFQDRADGIQAPGRLQTVTTAGVQYLVVANSGANEVLVYRGLGSGVFDAGSVQSFFVGTDPVGITIADVNGDGIPDVAVANQGSNDVSVLLGNGQGVSWSLTAGPRLRSGGTGPVSTTVQDVNGDGIPDILAVNSQSNSVALLPGVGNGFFNDRNPTLFATGADPVQALVGHFGGGSGPDLLTINAGSNDLTFFSNLGAGHSIASGGLRPLAGIEGDFSQNGFTDVIVANNGDGVFSALLGGPDGPHLAGTLFSADVLHPTDLALADLSNGILSIFATQEGVESVARLTFGVDFGGPAPHEVGGQRPIITQLLPLNESSLDVVATAVTGTGGGETGALSVEAPGSGLLVLATAFLGGSVSAEGEQIANAAAGAEVQGLVGGDEVPAGNAQPGAARSENGPLSDFVIGVGEEAERIREGMRQRLHQPEKPATPKQDDRDPDDQVFQNWPKGIDGVIEGLARNLREATGSDGRAETPVASRRTASGLPESAAETVFGERWSGAWPWLQGSVVVALASAVLGKGRRRRGDYSPRSRTAIRPTSWPSITTGKSSDRP